MATPKTTQPNQSTAQRLEAAIEAWYEKHFHRCITSGTAAITAEEKDALHKATQAAVATPTQDADAD